MSPNAEAAVILKEALPQAARTLIEIMEDSTTAAGTRAAIAQQIITRGLTESAMMETQTDNEFELTLRVIDSPKKEKGSGSATAKEQ